MILLKDHFTIKVSRKKIPIEEYDILKISTPPPPFLERENLRYDIVPTLRTKCPFDIKGICCTYGYIWNIFLLQWIIHKILLFIIFSIKVFAVQNKVSCFQIDSLIWYTDNTYQFYLEWGDCIFRYYMSGMFVLYKIPSSFIGYL